MTGWLWWVINGANLSSMTTNNTTKKTTFDERKFAYTIELIERLRNGHDVKVNPAESVYGFCATWREVLADPYLVKI